jgi:hypothetical protein
VSPGLSDRCLERLTADRSEDVSAANVTMFAAKFRGAAPAMHQDTTEKPPRRNGNSYRTNKGCPNHASHV